jgi:RNA polymerase sigma factor (sigma-70 family)
MERSDAELMKDFSLGEAEALGKIISRYKVPLYSYLLRLSGSPEAAADLFQDVFVKIARSPGAYSERFKFSAWLFTVGHHAAMDYLRRRTARRTEALDGDGQEDDGLISRLAAPGPGPDGIAGDKELKNAIERALALLSSEQREAFYLRHYSGLSFKEIAVTLGVPIGTALARVSRAAAALRRTLEEQGLQ